MKPPNNHIDSSAGKSSFCGKNHVYYLLGKYDEAITEAKKAIGVSPKDIIAHCVLICSYLSLGREEEARAEAAEILRIDPSFSVDRSAKIIPLKNREKAKRISDAYRKAGLK
jgi:adenylate cyclase